MSTPIWDTGDVAACICAQHCHRCNERGICVQLMRIGVPLNSPVPFFEINLCLDCFAELQLRTAEILLERQVLARQESPQG